MKTIKDTSKMRKFVIDKKARGKKVGFVPTMGYLHEGHLSLLRRAKRENGIVIMSIFVNPTQFGPGEDYARYPRDFKRDARMAREEGVDAIFYPQLKDMYLPDHSTYVNVESLSNRLCGRSRPGHFRGVATIVTKLFNIVPADNAYLGQKDAQQAIIIKKMAHDLNIPLNIKVVPTVREKDGLAMSSRNVYLNKKARHEAAAIFKSLSLAKKLIKQGERNSRNIIKAIKDFIVRSTSAKIDYVSIVDTKKLKDTKRLKGQQVLIAIAVYFGKTRLIDNIILNVA